MRLFLFARALLSISFFVLFFFQKKLWHICFNPLLHRIAVALLPLLSTSLSSSWSTRIRIPGNNIPTPSLPPLLYVTLKALHILPGHGNNHIWITQPSRLAPKQMWSPQDSPKKVMCNDNPISFWVKHTLGRFSKRSGAVGLFSMKWLQDFDCMHVKLDRYSYLLLLPQVFSWTHLWEDHTFHVFGMSQSLGQEEFLFSLGISFPPLIPLSSPLLSFPCISIYTVFALVFCCCPSLGHLSAG